jgi:DNA-binding IclR family transcriptional regulator
MIPKILDSISKQTEESVGYAILEGNTVLSLYEIEIDQPLKMNYKPGLYYPMNRGCYGKCLMAYNKSEIVEKLLYNQKFEKITKYTLTEPDEILKEYQLIREQGYVVSYCEVSPYFVGVGIPIFNSRGLVKASIAISFLKGIDEKEDKEKIDKFLKILKSYSDDFTKVIL